MDSNGLRLFESSSPRRQWEQEFTARREQESTLLDKEALRAADRITLAIARGDSRVERSIIQRWFTAGPEREAALRKAVASPMVIPQFYLARILRICREAGCCFGELMLVADEAQDDEHPTRTLVYYSETKLATLAEEAASEDFRQHFRETVYDDPYWYTKVPPLQGM